MVSPAQPQSGALLGYGTHFQILNINASPDAWVELAEVFSITFPGATVDQVDVTHMQSPGRFREYINGMIEGGDPTLEMNYVPGSATDLFLNVLVADIPNDPDPLTCRIILPNDVIIQFSANLAAYDRSAGAVDAQQTATVSFKNTGLPTQTAAP